MCQKFIIHQVAQNLRNTNKMIVYARVCDQTLHYLFTRFRYSDPQQSN